MAWNRILKINDPLLCRTAMVGSDFEILPTAKGIFEANITQVDLNRLRLARYRLSLPQVSSQDAARPYPGRVETLHESVEGAARR
jgi:hypothetical protein